MDEKMTVTAPQTQGAEPAAMSGPVDSTRLRELDRVLQAYKAGKASVDRRIIAAENWWKLRNSYEEAKGIEDSGGFKAKSGWLHNVIVSKHADAMEAYPEPVILPRESQDRKEADMLTSIVPCVLEQNEFEEVYNAAMWQKLKTGTGGYKVYWDKNKLGSLGDISIENVQLLNLFWEPGITDIQESKMVFYTVLQDNEVLEMMYPELKGKNYGKGFLPSKFLYDDNVPTDNKSYVIECYYHKYVDGRKVLHYVRYVGDIVLYATENDTERPVTREIRRDRFSGEMYTEETAGASMAERGMYDHGMFPFVLDTLFPVEGSPCGYGFVDLCFNNQISIDLMRTAFVKNTMVGATPRYFKRMDGDINEEEFTDLSKAIVHVTGSLGEESLRLIPSNPLSGNYLNMLESTIDEMRETSGNTEAASGAAPSGVTAASAIAALQEASGKGSRDSSKAAYRAYRKIVNLCIELIRQFYDVQRKFRITGQDGEESFISYKNTGIKPMDQGMYHGIHMGYRLPVFDIKVKAQKQDAYSRLGQNELALQFLKLGFFAPQNADQALACLGMMDFEGKYELIRKLKEQSMMMQRLNTYMNMAMALAKKYEPQLYQQMVIGEGMSPGQGAGQSGPVMNSGAEVKLQGDRKEHALVSKARETAQAASQPGGKI